MNQLQEEMIQDLIVSYKKRVNQVALELVTRAQDTLLFIKNPLSLMLGQTLDLQKSKSITREQIQEMLQTQQIDSARKQQLAQSRTDFEKECLAGRPDTMTYRSSGSGEFDSRARVRNRNAPESS